MLPLRLGEFPVLAPAQRHTERRITNCAGYENTIAGPGTGAPHHRSLRNAAEHGDRNRDWSRRAIGVAAKQRTIEQNRIATKSLGKSFEPVVSGVLRKRQGQQE